MVKFYLGLECGPTQSYLFNPIVVMESHVIHSLETTLAILFYRCPTLLEAHNFNSCAAKKPDQLLCFTETDTGTKPR